MTAKKTLAEHFVSARAPWPRRLWADTGLTAKMGIMVVGLLLVLVGSLGYLGISAIQDSTRQMLHEREMLAQVAANHLDAVLAHIERMMTDAAGHLSSPEEPLDLTKFEQSGLRTAYQQLGLFSQQLFLLNNRGEIVLAEPTIPMPDTTSMASVTSIVRTLQNGSFALSGLVYLIEGEDPAVLASVPIRNTEGVINGVLVASLDLTSPEFNTILQSVALGQTGYMEAVSSSGMILLSTRPDRFLQWSDHKGHMASMIRSGETQVATCHDCHLASNDEPPSLEIMAFAPLTRANWGVVVRQHQEETFIAAHRLQGRIIFLGIVALLIALVLVWLFTRSVITPLQFLTGAAQHIAQGDLKTPIRYERGDEIGTLAKTFDDMRIRLREFTDEIQAWNRELDKRVCERTQACMAAQAEALQARNDLQAIIDGLSDELVVMDLEFRVLQINAAVQERWNGRGPIIGQPCWIVNHEGYPCESPHCECPVMKVMETDQAARATHFRAHRSDEGRYVDIIASPLRDQNGDIRGVIELLRDVTEEMKVKQMRDRLLKELITAQEEERKRIARELHDETSQALTALAVGLETAIKAPAESAEQIKERLLSFKSLAGEALGGIQRIILDLRPAILDDLGLVQAIDWYAESRLKSQGIQIGLEVVGEEGRLASEVETTVFRIAQEAITNIARHAGAENVSIELEFTDSVFVLNIEDDGYGFDPKKIIAREKGNTSFGLLGMRERATLFGGTLKVQSQVEQGTRITVEIPLEGTRWNGQDTCFVGGRPCHSKRRLESTPQPL